MTDVTLPVLDAALEAVAHIVTNCRINQDYIRTMNGLDPLAVAFEHCLRNLPPVAEMRRPTRPQSAPGAMAASAAVSAAQGMLMCASNIG